jgi:lipopolysaccharide transport system ATP-binding protein
LQTIWGRDRHGHPKQYYREFWALQSLSFQLHRGQTLGIVGRNGSGKSTLLQLVCGTLEPTSGRVQVRGRVGALLELGSGFNPEFSGMDNVFLNASLLGLSQSETEERLDRILAFADVGEFIHQPVKTYSSGMAVRLAFAVQAHVDPDVLVVDEALAVGDELFQKKCYSHLERLKERGTAVLLVTHSCPQIIQHCDQALLLHKGKARTLGQPSKVTVIYQRLINASDQEWEEAFSHQPNQSSENTSCNKAARYGDNKTQATHSAQSQPTESWFDPNLKPQSTEIYPSHGGTIMDAWIETSTGKPANAVPFGERFNLVFTYEAQEDLDLIACTCQISNHTGQRISGQTLPANAGPHQKGHLQKIAAGQKWQVRFHFHGGLWPGLYFIGGGIVKFGPEGKTFVHRVMDYRALRIFESEPATVIGACSLKAEPAKITIDSLA